ncbi:hypothetical protein BGZ91_005464 [Linnemannia elongata]|nr:hypothetical protein BGZ91_005464 [Linnemannia elongata]
MSEPHQHRSNTKLKQQNKPFKSKHLTKSSLRDKAKGKVERVSLKNQPSRGFSNRTDRRNAAKILQQKKREELFRKTKIFDGKNGTPKVVAVVALCADVSTDDAVAKMFASVDQVPANQGTVLMTTDRFKQKLQFVPLQRNYIDIMDAAKVADFILFVMSAVEEVDKFGEMVLAGIQSQGVPSVVAASINWRDTHPYMLAEDIAFEENPSDPSVGTLKVTGYARGTHFQANRLVHLQNFGDFQIEKITSAPITHKAVHVHGNSMDAEDTETVLDVPVPGEQDDLAAENEPDLLANEQTWPTEEELMEAEERVKNMDPSQRPEQSFNTVAPKKAIRRVPKGTSNYQAAWIVDSDHESDEDIEDEDEDEDDHMDDDDLPSARNDEDSGEEYEDLEVDNEEPAKNEDVYEDELEDEEEARQYAEYLAREKENRDDMEFPDEVEAPMDVAAQVRFARYRALESFRTSPWDPYENLPLDYGRIFQFENFRRTKYRVMNQSREGGVLPGTHITIYISNVPRTVLDTYSASRPFIVFGLLQYEHKMGVINFVVNRNAEYDGVIKAKDPLVLHCGFRRFVVSPIFSQNSRNGKGTNNVHKSERFLQHGRSTVVTVYAPIQFGSLPVVLTKDGSDVNSPILVATGTLMDADPRRIVAKRIILTGHPFKVHKRTATIRFMFFNPDDVWYYKSVELRTKLGRTGHIKESLGTHGYFKAQWDQQISMQDTVMMCLYKRVYPKWGTHLWVNPDAGSSATEATTMVESMDMD